MSDTQNNTPESHEYYKAEVANVVPQLRPMLEEPLPAEVEAKFGPMKLAKREVSVEPWTCAAGHTHKSVILTEIFNKAGAPDNEPVLDLDTALDEFKAKALEIPADAKDWAEFDVDARMAAKKDGSAVKRFVVLDAGFETAASLANPPQPQVQVFSFEELEAILGGQKPGGPKGPGGLN